MSFSYSGVSAGERDSDVEAFAAKAESPDFDSQIAFKADLADQTGPVYTVSGNAEYAAWMQAIKIWISNVK